MFEHPTPLNFAHGGSAFVLSGAAVKDFAVTHKGIANRFDTRVPGWWYGDFVLADALDEELQLHVTGVQPRMNGDDPAHTPFFKMTWCQPSITIHHMDSKMFDDVYKFERAHNFSELLFRDIYAATYATGLPSKKEEWDNLSGDGRFSLDVVPNDLDRLNSDSNSTHLNDPHRSFWACEIACKQNEKCFQFSFAGKVTLDGEGHAEPRTECHLSSVFRLGEDIHLNPHAPGTLWSSGWLSDRISKWIEDHQDCSNGGND